MSYFIKVTSILISAISIIANALVCHIIVRLKTMKTSINYIILNLAILDAIVSFITIFYVISHDTVGSLGQPIIQKAYDYSSVLTDVLCKLKWTYYSIPSVSPMFLTAMAYERYKAIVDPFSRLDAGATKTRIKCMLTLAWLSGLTYLAIDMSAPINDKDKIFCRPNLYTWFNLKAYLSCFLITQYIIPSTAMLIFYGCTICALRKRDNALGPQGEAEIARHKAVKKVMRVIIVVTLVFYICCGIPEMLQNSIIIFGRISLTSTPIWDFLVVLLSLNSFFNPFLYFIFIQSFRDGFKRVFLSRFRIQNSKSIPPARMTISNTAHTIPHGINDISNSGKNEPQLLSIRFVPGTC